MVSKAKKGVVARLVEGKERGEDYARESIPENRLSAFWGLFRGKFGRLILANLFMLVTLVPLVLLVYFRGVQVGVQGTSALFGSGLGVGYPVIPDITGHAEHIIFQIDLFFYGLMIPAAAIAALGVAGGAYVIHNYVYTQKVFAMRDFFRGIKRSYWSVLEALLIFAVVLFLARLAGNYADYAIVMGGNAAGFITLKVFAYLFVALFLLVCLWMISLGVSYRLGPWALFRNAVVMTVGTFPQTVLFAALAAWPVFLVIFTEGLVLLIGLFLFMFMSISYFLLVWMSYSQWAFDKYLIPDTGIVTGSVSEKDKQGVPRKKKRTRDEKAEKESERKLVVLKRSRLMSRPIQPIEDGFELYSLSESFSRDDLVKLQKSKTALFEGVKAYEEAHKNDERYVSYNKQFDERERAFEEQDGKKKKKKRVRRPKMLNLR